jgi:hypothetical protein
LTKPKVQRKNVQSVGSNVGGRDDCPCGGFKLNYPNSGATKEDNKSKYLCRSAQLKCSMCT